MKNISIQGNCSPLTFPKLFSSNLSWTNGNIYSWEYIHFCFELSKCPCDMIPIFVTTAWKVSKYGVISGPYFPVFEPEITPYLDTSRSNGHITSTKVTESVCPIVLVTKIMTALKSGSYFCKNFSRRYKCLRILNTLLVHLLRTSFKLMT